ncbi:MAG TPA: phenylalanine--tRNA ligase subunit beta [Methylomirabilota bacterium]|nr:phenylalanine--tRNA ligase subunit beta [Methylomirabilota bacterium]
MDQETEGSLIVVSITSNLADLEQLVGKQLPRNEEQLNELFYSIKCEISNLAFGDKAASSLKDDTELQIENVDTNRPDTWSTEGIARALRGILELETGLKRYDASSKIATDISVDKELKDIRPYIACVVARGVKLSDEIIRGVIQLQEKLDQSYGRKRKRSSIGFYDFDLISPPLRYGIAEPDSISFIPLQGTNPMTLREILQKHPKGIEYGQILADQKKLPILMDAKNQILSFPPIINSNDLGRIVPQTKNILVEITGTNMKTVLNCLTILATTLADRGGKLFPARIHYKYAKSKRVITPDMRSRTIQLSIQQVNEIIGFELTPPRIIKLLGLARYDARRLNSKTLTVTIPCYRLDILHPNDVIEDIATAYGLNKIEPKWPSDLTIGGLSPLEDYSDRARGLMVGFGFQEVLTFMMTNKERVFSKMNKPETQLVEISNPKVITLTCLRPELLPSLLEFLSNNTHVQYPQNLFEIGDCTIWTDEQPVDIRKLSCVSAHAQSNFTEMKSILETLMLNLGFNFDLKSTSKPSFLEGRVGNVLVSQKDVGWVGEVHPQVIENWKLENPVTAMELDLSQLFTLSRKSSAGEAS